MRKGSKGAIQCAPSAAPFALAQIAVDDLDRHFGVGGVGHGLACPDVVEGRAGDGEFPEHVLAGVVGDDNVEFARSLNSRDVVEGRLGDVDLAGAQGGEPGLRLGHGADDQPVDMGRAVVLERPAPVHVVGVTLEGHRVAPDPAHQLERPGADRRRAAEGFRFVGVADHGREAVGEERDEGAEAAREVDPEGQVVDHLHRLDRPPRGLGQAGAVRCEGAVDGELDVLRGERAAVVAKNALVQREGVGEAVLALFPTRRHVRPWRAVHVEGQERVEDLVPDLH
jgi:hypothetical protein